jgi:3-hydroxyisobutyrate dehydrogenase-like beta-hydroxyacid dehydrogenase
MTTQRPARIGFVGLGRMGSAIASNLAASGYPIVGFVRRPEHITDFSQNTRRAERSALLSRRRSAE